jgi:uncharacterized protein YpbB
MNPKALKHMKSLLPKGYREIIAKTTGYSTSYIDRVFNGTRSNQTIIDAGLSILEDQKDARQISLDRLNRIISSVA